MRAALALVLVLAAAAVPAAGATPRACRSSDLRLVLARSEGAAGTLFDAFRLSPHPGVRCAMRGFPRVSVLGLHGRTLPIRFGRESGGGNGVVTRTYTHASPARFDVRHPSFAPRSARPCRIRAFFYRVVPPNETEALIVSTGAQPHLFCRANARVTPVGRHY